MSLFEDFEGDWDEIEEPSLGVPAGTYEAILSSLAVEEKESGKFLVFTYTVTEGPQKGKSHREFKSLINNPSTEKEKQAMGWIKARLGDLGVEPERMNSITEEELIGTEVIIRLVDQKNNPQYRNVYSVTLASATNDVPELASQDGSASSSDLFG